MHYNGDSESLPDTIAKPAEVNGFLHSISPYTDRGNPLFALIWLLDDQISR